MKIFNVKQKVFNELKDYFNDQFRDLKRDIHAEGEWTAENIRKKVRQDTSVSLKSISNRKQYSFTSLFY